MFIEINQTQGTTKVELDRVEILLLFMLRGYGANDALQYTKDFLAAAAKLETQKS